MSPSVPFKPRKRFGQNFLRDTQIIADILTVIDPKPSDRLIEIGPGLGALTKELLLKVEHLDVIEIDQDLAAQLEEKFKEYPLTIHLQDVLHFDFGKWQALLPDQKIRVVGNLPYNISTPLLFHLIQVASVIEDMHFMLQKEVVDRITAEKDNKDYGRLSVMVQYFCHPIKLFEVPPKAFFPAPKVTSAFLRLIPKDPLEPKASNFALFKEIVNASFQHRRKTLQNTLKHYLTSEELKHLHIDGQARAENLSLKDFVSISQYVHEKRLI